MKTGKIVKLGISMLVVLMAIGTVSASGGSSYYSAEDIDVPWRNIDIWEGEFSGEDWYKFDANNGDDVYIDVQYWFAQNGGEMKLHDSGVNDIAAWVSSSQNDHWAYDVEGSPDPRIEINAGSQFDYQFIAGRY